MKSNLKLIAVLIVICSTLFVGCTTVEGIFGKNSKNVAKQATKIELIKDQQSLNDKNKVEQVSFFSAGIEYSLDKVTNKEPSVIVAQDLNDRIKALVGNPSLEEQKIVWKMVDDLISSNKAGVKILKEKDLQIKELQIVTKALEKQKEDEVKKALALSQSIAGKADASQAQIDELKGNWGINAIWFGLKTLFTRIFWTVTIFLVIYTILRFAAMSNPIAASIFQIFNLIGSWAISIIKSLAPDSVKQAGHVPSSVFNSYAETLTKVVDVMQQTKTDAQKVELAKALNEKDSEIVGGIKKSLLY